MKTFHDVTVKLAGQTLVAPEITLTHRFAPTMEDTPKVQITMTICGVDIELTAPQVKALLGALRGQCKPAKE